MALDDGSLKDGSPKTSRRELNKRATRMAIIDAAVELLRARGLGNFTAEDVAEAAGISRRTFFNYFSSPEAALSATLENFLEGVIAEFAHRPANESLLDSAIASVESFVEPTALARMAEVCHLTQTQDEVQRWQLAAWEQATQSVTAAAEQRLGPDANPLFLRALVASIIASGRVAVELWLEGQAQSEIDDQASEKLRALITAALHHVRTGFA
ncbi:TetR/AcrR family transcriptional regulator [Psychromicrobium xiongbiense]|uniref:TetR/AcrR family transcriptional regulator n=1 Tax=Psychromicrobium xiongbiense TaxID=3051184 RepID=UPI0025533520|nr:TetR/AcrR family transcriptional regulator [Psychromicrobium sp. YIM S02556]